MENVVVGLLISTVERREILNMRRLTLQAEIVEC